MASALSARVGVRVARPTRASSVVVAAARPTW